MQRTSLANSEGHEIDEVTRTYPVDFAPMSSAEVWRREPLHLFVLVPFCQWKCPFCPFNSSRAREEEIDQFFRAVMREIEICSAMPQLASRELKSIWIGGGTPSYMSTDHLSPLVEKIQSVFQLSSDTEFTFEANPQSISAGLLDMLQKHGVTRLSIGVQSLHDKYLRMLVRGYTDEFVVEKINAVAQRGFAINVDMMYRLPGQTLQEVESDFSLAARLPISHLSAFPLILWPRMNLAKRIASGHVGQQADYETYVKMYHSIGAILSACGMPRYAYNYYSRDSAVCRYHIGRWGAPQEEVLGVGPGAFSFVNGVTYCNQHDRSAYAETLLQSGRLPVQSGRRLTLMEVPSRYVVLGLRFREISLADFRMRFGVELGDLYSGAVERLTDAGYVEISDSTLLVTEAGMPHILEIGREFYTANNRGKLQPQYDIIGVLKR